MAAAKYLTIDRLSAAEIARIFSKIKIDPVKGCWLWTGGRSTHGYGKIKFRRRDLSTHRMMWAWIVGPLPNGQAKDIPNIDHFVCDTKLCCFPAHMKLVLPRENTLRSNNPPARNSRRTHCKKGHELPKEPRYGEGRTCRTCRDEWHKSERYVKWNAEFGRNYHQSRRYGPDREAFLKEQREKMRAWKQRKRQA